jgi:hypothetical protein
MELGDAAQPHVLQFGDQSWVIVRQTVVASRKEATRALREVCRKAVQAADLPDDQPGPAERRFLEWISASKPAEEEPGRWRLYEFEDAFPMIVGTRPADQAVASAGHRVVTWGIAVAGGPQEWTVFAFHPAATGAGEGSVGMPLPPHCRMVLSMEVAGGGVMAFQGPLQAEECKTFFDSWCQEHGWRTAEGWRQQGPAWQLHCTDKAGGLLNVHFRPEHHDELSGMVLLTPQIPATSEGKRPGKD